MTTRADPSAVFVAYRPNPRRRLAVLAALAAVLLVFTMIYVVRWGFFRPAAVVTAYFDALRDKNIAAALRLTTSDAADPADRALLDPDVLRSPGYLPPEEVVIDEVIVTGRDAAAEVAFTVAGTRQAVSLRLRQGDGVVDRLLQRWRIVNGLGWMEFGAAPEQVTVNGKEIPTPLLSGGLPALPGGYRVGVPDNPWWEGSPVMVGVAPGQTAVAEVALTPTPSARQEVDRQVAGRLDRCATSTELAPPGCPFAYQRVSQATDIEWTIIDYPRYGLIVEWLPAPGGAGRLGMLLSASAPGRAGISGSYRSFASDAPFSDEVEFWIDGMVTIRGGTVVVDLGSA